MDGVAEDSVGDDNSLKIRRGGILEIACFPSEDGEEVFLIQSEK